MENKIQANGYRKNDLREKDLEKTLTSCEASVGSEWYRTPVRVELVGAGNNTVEVYPRRVSLGKDGLTLDVYKGNSIPDKVVTAGDLRYKLDRDDMEHAIGSKHNVIVDCYMERKHAPHIATSAGLVLDRTQNDRPCIVIKVIDGRRKDFFKEAQKDLTIGKNCK